MSTREYPVSTREPWEYRCGTHGPSQCIAPALVRMAWTQYSTGRGAACHAVEYACEHTLLSAHPPMQRAHDSEYAASAALRKHDVRARARVCVCLCKHRHTYVRSSELCCTTRDFSSKYVTIVAPTREPPTSGPHVPEHV